MAGAPFLLIFASSFVSSSFPRSCSFFFSFVYDFRTVGDWRGAELVSISANVKEKKKKRKENSRPLALRASTVRLID